MKWLLIIAGVVVALVVVVWIIGALLPRHHTASRTARFKQKPDTIFAAITDWRSFPQWRKELKEVRPRDGADGRESWIELSKFGELPMEIIESDPPRRLVGRIADPEHKLPFGGTWTYTITPDGDGDGRLHADDHRGRRGPPRFLPLHGPLHFRLRRDDGAVPQVAGPKVRRRGAAIRQPVSRRRAILRQLHPGATAFEISRRGEPCVRPRLRRRKQGEHEVALQLHRPRHPEV